MWIYTATIIDSSGKTYDDEHFLGSNDSIWQDINDYMLVHLAVYDPEYYGFGGDDRTGIVMLEQNVNIPKMTFKVKGKNYAMVFNNPHND
jgi:hypothetical protein